MDKVEIPRQLFYTMILVTYDLIKGFDVPLKDIKYINKELQKELLKQKEI